MNFPNIFGSALLTVVAEPVSLLPPACTTTSIISLPATTSINNSTLLYNAPLNGDFSYSFPFTTTTYTTVISTRGADGVISSQEYTMIGTPVEVSMPQSGIVTTVLTSVPDFFPVDSSQVPPGTTSVIRSQAIELSPSPSIMTGLPSSSPGPEVRTSNLYTYVAVTMRALHLYAYAYLFLIISCRYPVF